MGQLVFQATLGGQVALAGPNTASSYTLSLPTITDTVATITGSVANVTGTVAIANGGTGLTSFTANQLHYGSFSTSANLTFNGTTLTSANDATISGLTVGKGGGSVATNTAVGSSAIASTATGSYNSAFGLSALNAITSGSRNTGVGAYSLYVNTTGANNTGLGIGSFFSNTTGGYNVAVGDSALYSNTTASNNTAVGYQAAYTNSTNVGMTAIGFHALYTNAADYNTAVGYNALAANTSGTFNDAFGAGALQANTTGGGNVAFGRNALLNNTTGTNNTAFGSSALVSNTTASYNVGIGLQAGFSNTTGTQNTFIGSVNSGYYVTTGNYNTVLGSYNGNQSGLDIRTASNYIVLSDGQGNPRIVVDNSGQAIFGGVLFNANSSVTISSLASNGCTAVAATTSATNAWRFYNPNGQVGSISISGSLTSYNVSSDRRLKENIAPLTNGLASVLALKPSQYNYIVDASTQIQGFIADELQAVVPHAVTGEKDAVDAEGKPVYQGVDASFLIPHLVAAIQEQQAIIEQLKAKVGL